jgi:hypothetical protein
MSSEKKTIKINPDLFKIDTSSTRKNRKAANPKEIRVKPNERNNKTLKRSLLKFIRNRQQEGINNILPKETQPTETSGFQSDFKDSLDYLTKLTKDNKQKIKTEGSSFHNHTLKRYDTHVQPQNIQLTPHNSSLSPVVIPKLEINAPTMSIKPMPPPLYGCLKGGQLPTYRTYISNISSQNKPPPQPNQPFINIHGQNTEQPISRTPGAEVAAVSPTNTTETPQHNMVSSPNLSTIAYNAKKVIRDSDIKRAQYLAAIHNNEGGNKKKKRTIPKQKKTLRRTFYIGKSKVFPKVSVLVSNKTIRNNISNKSTKIRQTPLTEVKRYLIKKGFIKVGSIAPPDVLRKMYESALLMCGEIQNHNADNLLYNYLNGDDETTK